MPFSITADASYQLVRYCPLLAIRFLIIHGFDMSSVYFFLQAYKVSAMNKRSWLILLALSKLSLSTIYVAAFKEILPILKRRDKLNCLRDDHVYLLFTAASENVPVAMIRQCPNADKNNYIDKQCPEPHNSLENGLSKYSVSGRTTKKCFDDRQTDLYFGPCDIKLKQVRIRTDHRNLLFTLESLVLR